MTKSPIALQDVLFVFRWERATVFHRFRPFFEDVAKNGENGRKRSETAVADGGGW
jgi:hypothetical protein